MDCRTGKLIARIGRNRTIAGNCMPCHTTGITWYFQRHLCRKFPCWAYCRPIASLSVHIRSTKCPQLPENTAFLCRNPTNKSKNQFCHRNIYARALEVASCRVWRGEPILDTKFDGQTFGPSSDFARNGLRAGENRQRMSHHLAIDECQPIEKIIF